MNTRFRTLALAALLPIVLVPLASAQAPTPGERWRQTMSMEAMGMKMPGMTSEVCSPKGQTEAPPVGNEDCQGTNMRQKGNTITYDMQCKDGTTGTMEMTQESPTKWNGRMTANRPEGQMTMVMRSEKLPGECDASEMERKVNKMIAQSEAQQRKVCMEEAKAVSPLPFVGATVTCKDTASVKAFCDNARTMRGFSAVSNTQRMGALYKGAEGDTYRTVLANTGKTCGFDPEAVRTQFCSTAQGKKEWKFLAEECPSIAKPLAQRECAGRDFTTPVSPPYVDFCSAYAAAGRTVAGPAPAVGGDGAAAGAPGAASNAGQPGANGQPATGEPATPTDKAKEALNKSKQALKGLFGR
jgi:Protein of unknown function (DUF3617)